ncbi:MAG: CsbD family protein [bacterium]|nr:CsbD family protein [bacterium]
MSLNWDIIQGKWNEVKADARIHWGKLTDSDMEQIAGNKDKLVGKLQQTYGWTRAKAENHVDDYFHNHEETDERYDTIF